MLIRLVCLLLCIAPVAVRAQDTAHAHVHFYRTSNRMMGNLLSPSIYFDRDKVGKLPNGRFFEVSVAPGKYALRADDEQFFVEHVVTLEAGHDYFVRLSIVAKTSHVMLGTSAHLQLDVVSEDEATSAMRGLKPVDPGKITTPATSPLPE